MEELQVLLRALVEEDGSATLPLELHIEHVLAVWNAQNFKLDISLLEDRLEGACIFLYCLRILRLHVDLLLDGVV